MTGVLFDSSVYINSFRSGDPTLISYRSFRLGKKFVPVWLSVVVLQELYSGASSIRSKRNLVKLGHDFDKANRLLVPVKTDWISAGKILNNIGEKFGFELIGKAQLTNDALIATTAARNGITLLTANAKDFARISEFRDFDWKLV